MSTLELGDALDGYEPTPGVVDEVVHPDATLRPHWKHVGSALNALGTDELRRRQRDVHRLLQADGATYRILATDRAVPWKLDAVPLLISSEEWAAIEDGIIQRAVLLDLVLRDLYGDQRLLQRGVIPPEIVFRHPGYSPACHDIALPDRSQLFTYAVDLGRDADGRFQVVSDFAQAPAGSGYALENRVVLSRVFPSLYRDAQVHRVAPFFRALRAGLEALGSHRSSNPRIVVLSPGTRSETAFEHAYTASHLGYSLVEGSDLVVRNGSVFLRSLGGLEPVDVILRRVDGDFCDPLELRGDSQLGTPGLVEACRQGTVSVVNTIGSAAIENPALNAFLPAAAQALLGQDLLLPSVTSWWCGDPEGRAAVLADVANMVVTAIDGRDGPYVGPMLTDAERAEVERRVEADPRRWAAHAMVPLSTTPTLTTAGLAPRRTLLRTYAVAGGGSYKVMAGGLTRVAPDTSTGLISSQAGALAKDTWVLSSEPEPPSMLWLRTEPAIGVDGPFGGLSGRAAENLFWVGRYAERAESVVRLLRAIHDRRSDQMTADQASVTTVEVLMEALYTVTYTVPVAPRPTLPPDSSGLDGPPPGNPVSEPVAGDPAEGPSVGETPAVDPDGGRDDLAFDELFSLTCDAGRPGSLAYAVARLLVSAEAVRDQLSIDTWQITSELEHQLKTLSTTAAERQDVVQGTLGNVMESLLALHGLAGESMIRDAGWHFLEAGRRIERGLNLVHLLSATLSSERDQATDSLVLESVLLSAESIITYRRRYRSRAGVPTVLDLLVADPGNPRSLRYQVDRLTDALAELPPAGPAGALSGAQRVALQLSTVIQLADTADLAWSDPAGWRPGLVDFFDLTRGLLEEAGLAVTTTNFAHLPPRRALDEIGSSPDGGVGPPSEVGS